MYSVYFSFMSRSTVVVVARVYSRASGVTSLEIEHGHVAEHVVDQLAQAQLVRRG